MAGAWSGESKQRLPHEMALRIGIAVIALLLGYISTKQTFAFAISKSNVERAHALDSGDGRISAEFAEQLAAGDVDAAQRVRADQLAQHALVDEPLAVPALTALALNAQLRGNNAQASRLFGHSDTLSRRELNTRLWLIEKAVGEGNVPGALRHYDIALRTSRGAASLLFPVLSAAITDPAIATELANTLAKRPPWSDALVQYLSISGPDPKSTANLLRRLALKRIVIPEIATANAVNNLITNNAFNDAWEYYRTLRVSVDPRRSRDVDFGAQLEIPTAFDWTPVMTEAGITASIQRTASAGIFDFAAPATVGGTVLQQMQVLPVGSYSIEGRSIGIEQPKDSRPYWSLSCTDGRELGRVIMPNSSRDEGRFGGRFTVKGECPAQILRLIARASYAVSGVSGQIARVALRPL